MTPGQSLDRHVCEQRREAYGDVGGAGAKIKVLSNDRTPFAGTIESS